MAMSDADFLTHIRETYADLIDPEWTENDFEFFISMGSGWQPLVIEYCDRVQAHLRETGWIGRYYLRQIKEKFGGLRCYLRPKPTIGKDEDGYPIEVEDFDAAPPKVYEPLGVITDDISTRSQKTCEWCGKPGQLRQQDGIYLTLCDEHALEFISWKEPG